MSKAMGAVRDMDTDLLEAVMGPIWAALGAIGPKALSDAQDIISTGDHAHHVIRWNGGP
jgi:hypothetical protein